MRPPGPQRRSLSILLVENDAPTARSLSLVLQRRGHSVRVAHDVAHAVQQAAEPFDVGVYDGRIGDESVIDLLDALPPQRRRPFVMLTGIGLDTAMLLARASGAGALIRKPCSSERLANTIVGVAQLPPPRLGRGLSHDLPLTPDEPAPLQPQKGARSEERAP